MERISFISVTELGEEFDADQADLFFAELIFSELVQCVEVFMADEFLVDVVVDDGEAAIQVTVEEGREDIEEREGVPEFGSPEHLDRVREPFADAVGVGIQHDPAWQGSLSGVRFLLHGHPVLFVRLLVAGPGCGLELLR